MPEPISCAPPEGYVWVAKYENMMGLAPGTPIPTEALVAAMATMPEGTSLDKVRKALGVRALKMAEIREDDKPVRYTNRAARRAAKRRPL